MSNIAKEINKYIIKTLKVNKFEIYSLRKIIEQIDPNFKIYFDETIEFVIPDKNNYKLFIKTYGVNYYNTKQIVFYHNTMARRRFSFIGLLKKFDIELSESEIEKILFQVL